MHILHDNSLDILLLKCHAFFKCKHHYIPEVDEMTIEIAFATRSKKLQNPRVPRTGGMEAKFAGFLRELRNGNRCCEMKKKSCGIPAEKNGIFCCNAAL